MTVKNQAKAFPTFVFLWSKSGSSELVIVVNTPLTAEKKNPPNEQKRGNNQFEKVVQIKRIAKIRQTIQQSQPSQTYKTDGKETNQM